MLKSNPNKNLTSKVETFINKNNLVEPLNWVLPNRKEFVEWINETFLKYRATGKEQPHSKKFTPFKYQQLLRDYMQNNSPYRGVLLYHSLGSGKTCTAITIAENLKTERNIVVMLPASLRTNFIEDGLLFCGDEKYKLNSSNYRDKYSFISYNANNTIQQLKKIGSLDNKVIIIEEVHNLISKMISGIIGISKQGLEIYNYLMNAQNAKIVALSGTPIINDPFECAILFNILRGFIELTYYRIISVSPIYGDKWDFSSLEEELLSNNLIDYFEINKINKSIEFHIKVRHYTEEYKSTLGFIETTCKNHNIIAKYLELKKVPLFPIDNDGETFRNYFVNEDIEKGDKLKNNEVFKRRILGLVSYYKSSEANYPKVEHKNYYRVPMSNYQFQIYELLRSKERLSERGTSEKRTKAKGKKQIKSTFRVFSRQASNFVFPEEIYRPYPDPTFIVSLKKNKENKNNIETQKKTERIMELEELANNNGKITSDYKLRIANSIKELVENGEEYFTEDGLDKLSPKMKMILENVKLSPGLVFIYSNFRTLEGVEIFSKVLDFNGFVKYGSLNPNNYPTYSIYSGTEDEKDKKKILKIFTSDKNKYGSEIKIILATSAGAEGLDLKNIRQIHIMEPYWNQMRIEQVIGRGVRRNSHIALPEKDRNIEIFRYFSIFSPKNSQITRDKLSTDEHIEQLSRKKQYIINELIEILKECAFDCVLNAPDIKGDYPCFNFGKNAEGFAFTPSISKNIISAHTVQNIKKVERTLTRGIYYDKQVYLFDTKKKKFYLYNDEKKKPVEIDTKKAKPLFVDKKTNEIFDVKSVEAQNPIRLGYVHPDNKISKKAP
jgi:superfamily II DNA or RNA helicase